MHHSEPFRKDNITDDDGAVYSVGLGTVIQADNDWRIVNVQEFGGPVQKQDLRVVRMRHNVDDTLAASPTALLYHNYGSGHFAHAVLNGKDAQETLNTAINEKGYEAETDIAKMMAASAGQIAVVLTNTRNSLLQTIKSIPGLSEGKLSDKFFMIVGTPYQISDKPKRLPSRDFIDQDRLYKAHECDDSGMLIGREGLKISFMLSDDYHDNSAVMQRPKIWGQRYPRKNKASDGANYSRIMKTPIMVWHHE